MYMDLSDWNNFLWRVIEERLYKPGSRLYLAFDESLLEEELRKQNLDVPSGSPTNALNECIRSHCRVLRSGFIGLSRQAGGRCKKDNWQWVFDTDETGRTFVLTFAVQQILAAEHMQSVSFYTAYWRMLGATAEETRINPFGDQGRNSFTRLWGQLRSELEETLGLEPWEITFGFGRGSNKYRNLPVSQSLLSEGDMKIARSAIRLAAKMTDDRLYAALRNTKFSKSGQRKVYMVALRGGIIAQFRDFLDSRENGSEEKAKGPAVEPKLDIDVSTLFLYEDYELFGDSIFHCTTSDAVVSVTGALQAYLGEHRCLVFQEGENRISATAREILQPAGTQIFLLGHRSEIDELLAATPDDDSIPRLSQYFSTVNTSLPNDFALVRCLSLPSTLQYVDISSHAHRRKAPELRSEVEIRLRGGLCVNRASNSYLLGFGPTSVLRNGEALGLESNCELDSETMLLEAALDKLSKATVACRFQIRFNERAIYVDMVDGLAKPTEAGYALTSFSLLPVELLGDGHFDEISRIAYACDVIGSEWQASRMRLVRSLESAVLSSDLRWIKADQPAVEDCLATISYLDLPRTVRNHIERKIKITGLRPWPLYHRWKSAQANTRVNY